MGAIRRVRAWPWELSRETNCSRQLARPGASRIRSKSILRTDFLVEPTSAERSRDRLRKRTRPQMATRALDRHLRLPGGAAGHGGRARLELRTLVHHSIVERDRRPAGMEREVLRRLFLAARSRPIAGLTWRPLS